MKGLILSLLLVGFSAGTVVAEIQTPQPAYQAGIHFDVLSPAWVGDTNEPVIYEFFSYMCPGCNSFEPIMDQLESKLSGKQKVIRIPVALYPQWEPHAKTYFTLEMMGELERVHKAFFAAIHLHKKQFRNLDDIASWMASSFDIDQQQFLNNAKSFQVDAKMRKSKQMITAMGIGRIPTLVVNGKNKLNFKQLQTAESIIDAATYLVNKNQ